MPALLGREMEWMCHVVARPCFTCSLMDALQEPLVLDSNTCADVCGGTRLRPPIFQQEQAFGRHCGHNHVHAFDLPLRALADQAQPAPCPHQQVSCLH